MGVWLSTLEGETKPAKSTANGHDVTRVIHSDDEYMCFECFPDQLPDAVRVVSAKDPDSTENSRMRDKRRAGLGPVTDVDNDRRGKRLGKMKEGRIKREARIHGLQEHEVIQGVELFSHCT